MTIDSTNAGLETTARGPALEGLCRDVLQQLRSALVEALSAAGVDPIRPRHAARVLGLDKTLMWRLSRIVGQPDVFQILAHVPHQAGFGILCRALAKAGVPEATVQRVHASLVAFDELVVQQAGDRATFELLAANFARAEYQAQSLEQGRKLAFRGNSAVWGAQARLQLSTGFLMPNAADPSKVDLAQVFGLVDLLRLRADVSWTLAHRQVFDDAFRQVRTNVGDPLDSGPGQVGSALIRDFSTIDGLNLQVEDEGGEQRHILSAGPVGRSGELTALFGYRYTAVGSRQATESDQFGQVVTNLRTPVEQLQLDLLVHEDLDWALEPHIAILGALAGGPARLGGRPGGANPLFAECVADLGPGLAGTATRHMARYGALLQWAFARLGADPARFRAFRFEMAFPPIPARAILYSELLPGEDDANSGSVSAPASTSPSAVPAAPEK